MRSSILAPHGSTMPAQSSPRKDRAMALVLAGEASLIKQLPWCLLQKTQTRKMPDLAVVARTPFWLFCAGQRRISPGQTTDGT